MLKNNFVVSLKSNNKYLKENNEDIEVEFDSEYSIWMKNLENRKALITVEIDGKDVLDGNELIVASEEVLDLKGFMKGYGVVNKFKFIKRIKEIEDYRGVTPEDGIIKVKVTFEKKRRFLTEQSIYVYPRIYTDGTVFYGNHGTVPAVKKDFEITYQTLGNTANDKYEISTNASANYVYPKYEQNGTCTMKATYVPIENISDFSGKIEAMPGNIEGWKIKTNDLEQGITVKGTPIKQEFYPGEIGELESESTIFVFKLYGFDRKEEPNKIIYTREKITCTSCGKKSKQNCKFCPRCGTSLI